MTRGRRNLLLVWGVVALLALAFSQAWLPMGLPPTDGGGVPAAAALAQWPEEERQAVEATLAVIAAGGPFAYARDGSEFFNREGRLPAQGAGYYREYTVETAGSSDRGARRIVAGRGGELYYTRDHYRSFIRLE
jgi:ribonuclease T1